MTKHEGMLTAEFLDDAWVRHLAQTYSLDDALVRRLGEEFLAVTEPTVAEFVIRSHLRYQAQGLRNEEIFRRLRDEVAHRRFRVEAPTERQIRRLIYG
jgi:hypothetical protein